MVSRLGAKLFSVVVILSLVLALGAVPSPVGAQRPGLMRGETTPDGPVDLPGPEALVRVPARADGSIDVILELYDAPSAVAYSQALQVKGAPALASLEAQARFQQINIAQQALVDALNAAIPGTSILYRAQRAYNGVAVTLPAARVKDLASLAGLKAVHALTPKSIDNSSTVPMINAPYAWQSRYTGAGMRIGVIDTGIDYLHTDLGGPGSSAYAANNTAIVGDVPNYPGRKVAGGYDFAGDSYTGANTPAPDPDPMDCNGHGSHVAGTIAGYGVNADGSTYRGPYPPAPADYTGLRIGPGVAPEAALYALRVFGCTGPTNLVVAAIDWAVDPNGDGDPSDHLDVINLSLGSPFGSGFYDPDDVASDNASLAGVIVVASAGNSGDTHYDVGSPSTATRAISVASVIDPLDIMDGFEVVNTSSPNDVYGSFNSIAGWSTNPVPAPLVYPNSPTNSGGCAAWTPGQFTGQIVLLDWTYTFAPSNTSECGSSLRVQNAYNAGAKGVIFANTKDYLDISIAGYTAIPSTITTQAIGAILKTRLNAGLVTVTLTKSHDGAIPVVDPAVADRVSSFSSRGPRRIDNLLKPDIAAPGQSVFSISYNTGDRGVSYSGTSMAAPHISGVMALLRQVHPGWTVEELKALAMNTATPNLTTVGAGVGDTYAGARAGAGRVDVQNALLDHVIAYNAAESGAVSLSFGSVEVPADGSVTLNKEFVVSNKNDLTQPALTFNVGFTASPSLPTAGVAFSVVDLNGSPVTALTLASGASAHLRVRMTADGAQMKHTRDKTMYTQQGAVGRYRHWMTEAGGNVTLTPVGSAVESVRLPVYAAARPVARMRAAPTLALIGSAGGASLSLNGLGLNTGSSYPVDELSWVTALELKAVKRRSTSLDPVFASGNFQYVGVMSNRQWSGSMAATTLFFGFSTYGNWTTPNYWGNAFDIYIDTNKDGFADFDVYNYSIGNPSDIFVSVVYDLNTRAAIGYSYLNILSAGSYDTSVFNTNVMVLPVSASLLKLTDLTPGFNFWLESSTREWEALHPGQPLDTVGSRTAPLTYDALNLAVDTLGPNPPPVPGPGYRPLYQDLPGTSIPVGFNKAKAPGGSLGLLLLHHHNGEGQRAQMVPLLDHQVYLPQVKR